MVANFSMVDEIRLLVEHEFATVPGVKEDVTNIILNLKQVRFKQLVDEFETEKVSIKVEGKTELKAGDFNKYLTGFEVLNPDLVICHLDAKATMQMAPPPYTGRLSLFVYVFNESGKCMLSALVSSPLL